MHHVVAQDVKRVACNLTVSVSADYCTNPGKVILTASPPSGVSYLWSTGETTKNITVDVAGVYSVIITDNSGCSASDEMSVGQELVTNGSFTAGNTGFTSGYVFKADSANYNKELYDDSGNNAYGVGIDGQNYHPSFWGKDHTNNQNGNKNFMLVNGHGTVVVWEETVPVEPNTNYYYSAWGMNLNPASPAKLQFEVNGEKIGTIADLNDAPKPSKASDVNLANWERFYYGSSNGWNSGSATTAVIRIIDLNADLNGNDFGLDDISFATLSPFLIGPIVSGTDNQVVCPGTSLQSITYKVGSGGTPSVTGLPPGVSSSFDGLMLTISGTPSTPGSYHYEVSTAGCTVPKTASGTLIVKNPGIWTGTMSSDWNNTANWCCGSIPTNSTDVEINAGLTNYPNITNSITGYCKNLSIDAGASLIISNVGTLQIGEAIANSGTLDATDGTIEMKSSDAQFISGDMFEKRGIRNLIVSNTSSSGLSVSSIPNDTLKITGTLSFGDPNGTLNTGGNLTLVSTNGATANVGKAGTGNSINGEAIVERYINIGLASGQHGKSWQFLSAPVSGQTIKQSWMENGNDTTKYGTIVSGQGDTTAGFDMYSMAPSVKYYVDSTNSWKGISSPDELVNNPLGYFVFVRGNRTVTKSNQPATVTRLRAKGTLNLGTVAAVKIRDDKFQTIGNPYASPIDFTSISKSAKVDDEFYVWDPYLYGSYGVGGYQLFSATLGWEPVPGGTSAYPSGVANTSIQSGQAFFVHATSSGTQQRTYDALPSELTITEDAKVSEGSKVNVTRKAQKFIATPLQALKVSLYTGPGQNDLIADGNAAVFDQKYSDKFDRYDALKIVNSGENFGLKNNGKLLSVDARSPLYDGDTLFYNMTNLAKHNYQLRFAPVNLESIGLKATLIDKFLTTETPVSLSDSTFINVAVTSDAASSAADRFKVVFRQMGVLPVTITSIIATNQGADNIVYWNVANEGSISQYEIEKSKDGAKFNQIEIVKAENQIKGSYSFTDKNVNSGTNYYRVKILSVDGKVNYTQVVMVANGKQQASISVYPNPIINNVVRLQFNNQPAGIYKTKLINSAGQILLTKSINHSENNEETINCESLPMGIYQLQINKPDGKDIIIKILK